MATKFTGYIANVVENKLTDIKKTQIEAFSTDTENQFRFVATIYNGEKYFYFFNEKKEKSLYERVSQQSDGIIVNKIDNTELIQAFQNAIDWGVSEVTIMYTPPQVIESPITPETQEQIKTIIQETQVLQPLIQPVIVQQGEPIQQYTGTIATDIFPEKISKPEHEINRIVRIPIITDATNNFQLNMWFWNDLPKDLETNMNSRPPLWVIARPEIQITPIEYADNKPTRFTASGQFIIQAFGTYDINSVYETASAITELLLIENEESGNISALNQSDSGWDSSANVATTVISYTLTYGI